MATKIANNTNLIDRTEIKNGVVLYRFASTSNPGYIYYVTAKDGKVDEETHQDCKGFHYHKHCEHIDHIKAEQASKPTYGTCGHLSKNTYDECPACRSRWYR